MRSKILALLFAMLSIGSMIAIPGLSVLPRAAYALDIGGIVGDALDEAGVNDDNEDDEEEEEDDTTDQSIEQPIDQENNQEVDQSEENEQDNDNTQTQASDVDQDIAQGIEDGDDSAKSESESGDAKHKSSSSSESGDAFNVNAQDAENNAEVTQEQSQDVTQSNDVEFGDDTADLDAVNVAIPIAVPINVDENNQEEEEQPPTTQPPEEEGGFFCLTEEPPGEGVFIHCFLTEEVCEAEEATLGFVTSGCTRVETLPPGAEIEG